MTEKLIAVPAANAEPYVELARTKQGRLFKKHILNKGELLYPGVTGGKVVIDDDFVAKLKLNFANGVCDIVQVPKAGAKNEHTEDPDRNIGEVVGIQDEGEKIYALIDARTDDADKLGKTLLGASAMMSLDYKDTATGEYVGPTLLHVAVTNRPYVTKLEDFEEVKEEILAASAECTDEVVVLTPVDTEDSTADEEIDGTSELTTEDTSIQESEPVMTLEELLEALKSEHNIDVPALQAQAAAASETAELTAKVGEVLTGLNVIKLSNSESEATFEQIVGGIAELAEKNVSLSNKVEKLEKDGVIAEVKALVASGHIEPANEAAMTELALSNHALFEKLVPENPIVELSRETGSTEVDTQPKFDLDKHLEHLRELGNKNGIQLSR